MPSSTYEESYALTEEFREWLVCLEEHPELLDPSVLMLPRNLHDCCLARAVAGAAVPKPTDCWRSEANVPLAGSAASHRLGSSHTRSA
jgi:hypothetical protein